MNPHKHFRRLSCLETQKYIYPFNHEETYLHRDKSIFFMYALRIILQYKQGYYCAELEQQ